MGRLTAKQLNKYELHLQKEIDRIMFDADVKFPVFLPVLRDDIPTDRKSTEYKNIHKSEYLKHLRASYSLDEINKMLNVLNLRLKFTLNGKEFKPVTYFIQDYKIRYTDVMIMCEALGIKIEWVKSCNKGYEKNNNP